MHKDVEFVEKIIPSVKQGRRVRGAAGTQKPWILLGPGRMPGWGGKAALTGMT